MLGEMALLEFVLASEIHVGSLAKMAPTQFTFTKVSLLEFVLTDEICVDRDVTAGIRVGL